MAVIWSGVEDETVLETSLSLDMVVTMSIKVMYRSLQKIDGDKTIQSLQNQD